MKQPTDIQVVNEKGPQLTAMRELILEYANSLKEDHWICRENIQKQVQSLLEDYTGASGSALLASVHSDPAGCVLMETYNDDITELKRLFVRKQFRGRGIGRALCENVLSRAKNHDFEIVQLVTTPAMPEAQNLYDSMGFQETEPFHDYGDEFIYMRKELG